MKRLFIVEDEAIIAMDLAEELEGAGFEVVGVAYDGESALEQLQDLDPNLILMDIVLGNGMDGIQTAEQILKTRSIPIIFLTAFSDTDTVARAAKTAPYGYITKPYNTQSLCASINVALTKQQLEHKLIYKERWFSNILHAVHDAIIAVGIDGLIHFANSEACRILEVSGVDELMGKDISELIKLYDHNGDRVLSSPVASAMQRNAVMPIVFNGSVRNQHTGKRTFIDYSAAPVRGQSNVVIGGLLALRDASQRLRIETEIRKSDGRFETAFDNSSVGVVLVALDGGLIDYNAAFAKLFKLSHTTKINTLEDLPLSYTNKVNIQEGLLALLSGQQANFQYEIQQQDEEGHLHWLMLNISLLHDHDGHPSYYFYQVYDLTDRKKAELKLHHLASYDALTGLLNYPQVRLEIENLVELNQFERTFVAVVTIDIDDFNIVNDTFSLNMGDRILAELAMRLRDIDRYNLLIGRPGGDRFILILHSLESVNQAMFITHHALDELREPCFIESDEILLTACAGIAISPTDGTSPDTLLAASAEALQIAKVNGTNQIHFYNEQISNHVKSRILNETRILNALDNKGLECLLFPITSMKGPSDTAFYKIRIFWQEADCYLTPESFIDIANVSGLSERLLNSVLDQLITHFKQKAAQNLHPTVIVPFYPSVLPSKALVSAFAEKSRNNNLKPEQFVFGLSSKVLKESKTASQKINDVKENGFKLCLNLFTGKSASVDLLHATAPEYCEFSIAPDGQTDTRYQAAILSMTKALNIPVILNARQNSKTPEEVSELASYTIDDTDQALSIGYLR
ncbi:GGDEF domain-containing response regulator [Oceanospirillum linum]|uniref:Two-component system response regulator n=1 Tax=Oceanospirillum linum TaxID=966 RepID=A0A1T1HCD2_OCELI|nr:diguanylate cyclase [Oceanospirillum linum]OOV87472.1 hypothetical protein BTA35_0205360 [Oceanospirillum linum]SEF89058.1 PAS domain S-box-containing protein/diguanylate cyclase (GGDEF) domain-containing protein [Oleiphilus messinensis]SMP13653.1 PAS domain S-box-containing protein/diguanylate cyclase (GGDEF) domain-containing protein [Oceanospirillum linum]